METEERFKEIVEVLSKIKSEDGSKDLLTHLEAMNQIKIELNDDRKYYDLFEDISSRLKQLGYYQNEKNHIDALQNFLSDYLKNVKQSQKLLEPPVKMEGDEATPVTQVTFIPDYYTLFNKLSWCGLGLSEKESYLLTNSLRNLAANLPGTVTFFGKIYGTKRDYYVAEAADVDPAELPEGVTPPENMEPRKEDGVNMNVFFVTNDLSENWKELPDVTPEQIQASRQIRYNFTGDLERKIVTNPHFNGQEKHLLHCQLSRIYHGTKLTLNLGNYQVDPEAPFKKLDNSSSDQKPKKFTTADLVLLNNWIHEPPGILKQGRVSHFVPGEGIEDPEEYKKKLMESDPFDKRIKPISEDTQLLASSLTKIKISPWKIQQNYENSVYINPYIKILVEGDPDYDPDAEQKDNKADYSIIALKSLRWPGAYNFYMGKQFYFFYFGNGQKFIDTENDGPFVYKNFPKIPMDEPDYDDQPEPTLEPKDPNAEAEGEAEAEGGEQNQEEAKEGGDEI